MDRDRGVGRWEVDVFQENKKKRLKAVEIESCVVTSWLRSLL